MTYFAELKLPVAVLSATPIAFTSDRGKGKGELSRLYDKGVYRFTMAKKRDEFVRICNATEMNSARRMTNINIG